MSMWVCKKYTYKTTQFSYTENFLFIILVSLHWRLFILTGLFMDRPVHINSRQADLDGRKYLLLICSTDTLRLGSLCRPNVSFSKAQNFCVLAAIWVVSSRVRLQMEKPDVSSVTWWRWFIEFKAYRSCFDKQNFRIKFSLISSTIVYHNYSLEQLP